MKIYIWGLLLLGFLYACTNTSAPKPEAAQKTLSNPDSISEATATQEKNAWENVRSQVITDLSGPSDTLSQYIVSGFRVPAADLLGVLMAINGGNHQSGDSIWAMMAVRDTLATLIFQAKDRTTGRTVYYDFTYPCPPGCPKK